MNLQQEYIIYAVQASLTILTVSSTFLIESTLMFPAVLIPSTVLFGYTAFISGEEFQKPVLVSLTGLLFLFAGGFTAATGIFISIGNVLVSVFASGEGFRNYFGSTALPLLFTGLVLGTVFFGVASVDPTVSEELRDGTAEFLGENAERMVNNSNMLDARKGSQSRLINASTGQAFRITKGTVTKRMGSVINSTQQQRLQDAFAEAETIIETQIDGKASRQISKTSIDISARVEDLVRNSFDRRLLIVIIPVTAFALYGMHPFIGFLTAVWASIFSRINVKRERDQGQIDTKGFDNDFNL